MKRLRTILGVLAVAPFLLANEGGCDAMQPTSDQRMNRAQEQLSSEAAAEIGMPAIRNFQEKRMMKTILELRDRSISTVTYLVDLNGGLHKLCDSVGYGLPYGTQFTNPQRAIGTDYANHPLATIPQADPNGLFSPAGGDGTWVQCLDPGAKVVKVVYVEPHVIVSPFPLDGAR